MRDLHQERAALDYPIGGSAAVIDALVEAVQSPQTRTFFDSDVGKQQQRKSWGKVLFNKHVESIIIENGKAVGVKVRTSSDVNNAYKAKRAVISNASIWNTIRLLTGNSKSYSEREKSAIEEFSNRDLTPQTNSFVHLHVGINGSGLTKDALETHYTVINTWNKIDSPQNHVIISVPSVLDPSLAPKGCHVIHAYAAANEVSF